MTFYLVIFFGLFSVIFNCHEIDQRGSTTVYSYVKEMNPSATSMFFVNFLFLIWYSPVKKTGSQQQRDRFQCPVDDVELHRDKISSPSPVPCFFTEAWSFSVLIENKSV